MPAILGETEVNHDVCRIVSVPPGALFLDLFHIYQGGTLTTAPTVRCYGLVEESKQVIAADKSSKVRPADFDSNYAEPTVNGQDWKPLCNFTTGDFVQALGDTTNISKEGAGGTEKWSKSATFNLSGVSKVIVVIPTAAAGVTRGCVGGYFGC